MLILSIDIVELNTITYDDLTENVATLWVVLRCRRSWRAATAAVSPPWPPGAARDADW